MAEFHSNLSSTRKDVNKYKHDFEMSLKWVARSEKEIKEKNRNDADSSSDDPPEEHPEILSAIPIVRREMRSRFDIDVSTGVTGI
jgi:hypothetical protein